MIAEPGTVAASTDQEQTCGSSQRAAWQGINRLNYGVTRIYSNGHPLLSGWVGRGLARAALDGAKSQISVPLLIHCPLVSPFLLFGLQGIRDAWVE